MNLATQRSPGILAIGLAVVGMAVSHVASSSEGRDWAQFRGPDGQGVCRDRQLAPAGSAALELVWKTALPGPGGSSPIVIGDRIYLTCYSGYAVPGAPAGDLESLQRHVVCLERGEGKIRWTRDLVAAQPEETRVRDHGYASSTPLADPERLYVFGGKSGVYAFDHGGKQLWQTGVGTQTHGWGSAASPIRYRDWVIVNAAVESESLVALHRETGKEVWRTGGLKESWNTPILVPTPSGQVELVVAIAGQVLGFDPATGNALWSCATGIGWYMVPSLVHDGNTVYCIGGRTGGALAVRVGGRGDVTSSHRLWTLNKGSNVASPVLHAGHLYFLHENLGMVYAVEAASGKVRFEERLERAGQFYGSPVLVEDRLYGVDRRGGVFVVAAQPQFTLLGRTDLGDRSSFDASPAVDGDRLLIRSDKYLYCLARRASAP